MYMENPPFDYNNVTIAYQTLSSPLSEILFKMIRRRRLPKEDNLVSADKMLRFILERKEENRLYFFISDQFPLKNGNVSTTFMGLPTLWVSGGEAVARKLRMPVVYMHVDRVERGKYVIKFSTISENSAETSHGEIMSIFSEKLEQEIFANKYNWLWSHKRWKNIND